MAESFLSPGREVLPALRDALQRLDALIDWERRDRAPGGRCVMRVDLEPMRDLARRLGHPERRLRTIHVAGTKGKGSVSSLLQAGLEHAGFRTGSYLSPHVERVHERILLRGRPIADEPLALVLERALAAREAGLREGTAAVRSTWFDVLTAAAFVALTESGVEWAVVECGLGGRLDSTNVLPPGPCVITNIDLEHTAILGSTRSAIAAEKAGIVKRGGLLVSGVGGPSDEAGAVVEAAARAQGVAVVRVEPPAGAFFEARNVALAGAVLEALGRRGVVAPQTGRPLARGLLDAPTVERARLPGRVETLVDGGVPVVLDGAHVPSSAALLLRELAARRDLQGLPVVVLGLGREKDAAGFLKALSGRVDRVLCTRVGSGPHRVPSSLVEEARRWGLEAEAAEPPEQAYARARHVLTPGGWVLVTGSLHLVGALRGRIACTPIAKKR